MSNKERFIELLRSTGRAGVDNVISNLNDLGFFEAPASTVFHLNTPGGLLQHSLNVYDEAVVLAKGQAKCPLLAVISAADGLASSILEA